ncbi:MAG: hypothetical protein ACRD4K_01990 [Candidatus Acidiferrales bacterium]
MTTNKLTIDGLRKCFATRQLPAILLAVCFFPLVAGAQQESSQDESGKAHSHAAAQSSDQKKSGDMQDMPGMDHHAMGGAPADQHDRMHMRSETFLQEIVHHGTSGTSAEPNSTPHEMLMTKKSSWMLMFHGTAFLVDEQQTSPRGGDKFFSTNWFMGTAQREIGRSTLTFRAMLSLEPATVTDRRYPLLFQVGETAFGNAIVDGQHPHDLFMELGALYDVELGEKALLSFYFAPIGDPAIGPTAYGHRASASENPVASLGHHLEDSTHIVSDVVTLGLTYGIVRIEASGFHGREPDENRWNIDQGTIDSWSTRLTIQPGKNWSGQYSYARIKSPEQLFPDERQERMTASIMYNRPFTDGNWASTILWGRTRSLGDNAIANGYLLESTVRFRKRNYAWTRIENVDRWNELLLGEHPLPPNFVETTIGRVQAYTFGFDREFNFIPHISTAPGGQVTAYGVGEKMKAIYGTNPVGVAVFVRFRPVSNRDH